MTIAIHVATMQMWMAFSILYDMTIFILTIPTSHPKTHNHPVHAALKTQPAPAR